MKFPGRILSQHRWIVLFSTIIVVIAAIASSNRSAYDLYMENAPEIPWENIPVSALTYFFYNLRSLLLSMFGLVLAFLSAIGLGFSIGVGVWIISQNSLGMVSFSHGILEIYSAFLGIVGGFLVLTKIGEALWGFFGKVPPHFVNWKEVAEEYGSLFLFSVIGLFVSAWMEAILAHSFLYTKSLFALIAVVNTLISLMFVSFFSSSTVRTLVTKEAKPPTRTTEERGY